MEFVKWDSTPRLLKDCVVTEKIDGTNACVIIQEDDGSDEYVSGVIEYVEIGDTAYLVGAQSRNRIITPEDDNAGFARWVHEHSAELVKVLGPGYHFGEWFGSGIQRGYGLSDKRFALFNSHRWAFLNDPEAATDIPGLTVVPTLYIGEFDTEAIKDYFGALMSFGSVAVPGFMKPEGLIVYHSAAKQYFKMTDQGDISKFLQLKVEAA